MSNPKRISSNNFEDKWSPEVAAKGFVSLPNCLVFCQDKMGIDTAEFKTLAYLIACKFDTADPWPGVKSIARGSGSNPSTIRKHLRDLENKGLLKRIYRIGYTSEYSLAPLIHRLKNHDCINPINKRAVVSSNFSRPPYVKTSTKEYEPKRRNKKNTGLSSIQDILGKRSYNE